MTRAFQVLASHPLFGECSRADLLVLAEFTSECHLSPRQCLFRQGAQCGEFYLLREGLFKLVRKDARGREQVMELIEPGGTFGEWSLFTRHCHSVSAIAVETSALLAFGGVPFTRFLQTRPALAWQLLGHLSQRLERLLDRIQSLASYSAEQRLAAYLLDNHRTGAWPPEPRRLPLRRIDLASLLGLTPETLCRTIGKFRRRGWIAVERNAILICHPDELKQLFV